MAKELDDPTLDPDEIDDESVIDVFEADDEVIAEDDIEGPPNIVTWCPSCNASRPHTLIEDEETPIVICSECSEEHPLEREPRSRSKSGGGSSRALVASDDLGNKEAAAAAWKKLTAGCDEGSLPVYSIKTAFKVEDVFKHPSFGVGVVLAELSPSKVNVLFKDGARILVCNRR